MKKVFSYISFAAMMVAGLSSCETYKVSYPGGTAVENMDGDYLCFAYDKSDINQTSPVAFFELQATNTAEDDADVMWFNMVDYRADNALIDDVDVYPEAVRFKVACDVKDQTFGCLLSETFPVKYLQSRISDWFYYKMAYGIWNTGTSGYPSKYYALDAEPDYTVSISDGVVVTDGFKTATGYYTDLITFSYTITHLDGSVEEYDIVGMKNTGWPEDVAAYDDWLAEEWVPITEE